MELLNNNTRKYCSSEVPTKKCATLHVPLNESLSPNFTVEQTLQGTHGSKAEGLGEKDIADEGEDEEAENEFVDTTAGWLDTRTFQECFEMLVDKLRNFYDALQYQIQFNDPRMLNAVGHEGVSFICLTKS
jgi:hypothetical protein